MHFKLLLPRVRLSACPVVQLSVCPFVRLASVDMPSKFAMLLATHNFPCTLSGQEEELISILVCCFCATTEIIQHFSRIRRRVHTICGLLIFLIQRSIAFLLARPAKTHCQASVQQHNHYGRAAIRPGSSLLVGNWRWPGPSQRIYFNVNGQLSYRASTDRHPAATIIPHPHPPIRFLLLLVHRITRPDLFRSTRRLHFKQVCEHFRVSGFGF